jgi:hypothetical protein
VECVSVSIANEGNKSSVVCKLGLLTEGRVCATSDLVFELASAPEDIRDAFAALMESLEQLYIETTDLGFTASSNKELPEIRSLPSGEDF